MNCVCGNNVSRQWWPVSQSHPPPSAAWPVHSVRYHGCQWPPETPSDAQNGYTHCHTTGRYPGENSVANMVRYDIQFNLWSTFSLMKCFLSITEDHHYRAPPAIMLNQVPSVLLTLPRSIMKQSPWLKLPQVRGTSVARITLRPLTWSKRFTFMSLVTTCWNPDATPPCCLEKRKVSEWIKLL